VIGDCRSAALVSRWGSIDWLCWPRFDSPAVMAAILDQERGGHWSIHPAGDFESRRAYVTNTNVLQTTFHSASGSAVLTDLMPALSEKYKRENFTADAEILRQLHCSAGEITFEFDFSPAPNFARERPRLKDRKWLGIEFEAGRGAYRLRSDLALQTSGEDVRMSFTLLAGQTATFSLAYNALAPGVLPVLADGARERIEESIRWWQEWTARCEYDGPFRESVIRSLLVLKLLAFTPSGAIIAAPTTSLPEVIGADWNWDYRYCWLRDASLTSRALYELGYHDEAQSFTGWFLHSTRLTQPELRVMYDIYGNHVRREYSLPHLSGYRGSQPVRVGNGARDQVQMDVYGEVVDAAAQAAFHGEEFDRITCKLLVHIGDYVCDHWHLPDQGIWEPRIAMQHHTHSKVLCWTALDRLLQLHEKGAISELPQERFEKHRDELRMQIESFGWNPTIESYTNVFGGDQVDPSLLQMAWYGFHPPDHPRMRSTAKRIYERLDFGKGLLKRNTGQQGMGQEEGAFALCSFWGAEYLALGGDSEEHAQKAIEELLDYANDLGLFAEEIDPETGEALGNFPQGYTHIGLINAALTLEQRIQGHKGLAHHRDSKKSKPAQKAA
jgi:GH15 family glucan-1,4-alpha-glucosidase